MRKIILLLLLALWVGGCSLDSFLFNIKKEEYSFSDQIIPAANRTLHTLEVEGLTIYGLHAFHTPPSSEKILYFVGNWENLNHYFDWIEIYWEMGYDVFAIEYEGFGKSEGSPSEDAIIRDGEKAMEFVTQQLSWEADKTIIYGYSLGAVPAIHLSATHTYKLLFLEAPMGSTDTVIESNIPLDIPWQFVALDKYDSLENIKQIINKVIIIHGKNDDTLPYDRNGLRLYENAPEPKKFVLIENAAHGDIPGDMGRENYKNLLQSLFTFWD